MAWALAGAGLLLATVLAFAFAHLYLNQPKPSVTRFLVSAPSEVTDLGLPALSPDGRFLAFATFSQDGVRQLWLRPLDNVAAHPLPGTDGAYFPFWSPDSRYLGFFASGSLKKIDVAGGPPQTIMTASAGGGSGSWNSEGVIIFSSGGGSGILKVSQDGGAPTPLTTLDRSQGEFAQFAPSFLPDGRHFLFTKVRTVGPGTEESVCIGSLDSKETKCLMKTESFALYAPPGYLLYRSAGALMAQPFDANHLITTGDAFPVASGVRDFSVSPKGTLAYILGVSGETELRWFDRSGKNLGTVGQPADYSSPALSPDGTRVVVGIKKGGAGRSLWVFDLRRGTSSRFTFDPADEFNPLWSRDSSQIIFTSAQQGVRDIYEKAASGLGNSEVVFESKDQQKNVVDWSPDGRYVVYDITTAPAGLWILPLFGDRKPFPFIQGGFDARQARFSPDGRYIAYASDESGDYEIYVQTFPEQGGKWQVSTGDGRYPEWRRDGKEIYFVSAGKLMTVGVDTTGSQFQAGTPKPLFEEHFGGGSAINPNAIYRVSADGQRFLAVTTAGQQGPSPITVVLNWAADLKP